MEAQYTKMPRKAAESWWKCKIPPEIAYYKCFSGYGFCKPKKVAVTWLEVFKERAEKQQRAISYKRAPDFEKRAAILSVNSKNWTCGYALCTTIKGNQYWVDYKNDENKDKICQYLMDNLPLGILCFDFNEWKKEFEKKYGKIYCFITLRKRQINLIEIKKIIEI